MSILFNRVQRGNPNKPTEPKKWYVVLKTLRRVSEKEVAKLIADETTLNPKEAEMALVQLEKVLINNLLNSQSVQLGDWGTFYLTCNSKAADTKEALNANHIEKINIRFLPGQALKEAIAKATFISADKVVSES